MSERTFSKALVHSQYDEATESKVMGYYERLIRLNRGRGGEPTAREASEDYTRMLESRYGLFLPRGYNPSRRRS